MSALPVADRRGDRIDQIRAAALEAFYRKGYHGTSLREIADVVGIKVPSLYNYISSKQQLLFDLMSQVMKDLMLTTVEAVRRAGPSPEDQLRAVIRAFILYNIGHPHEAAVSDAELRALNRGNLKSIIRLRDEFDAIFSDIVVRGIDSGAFAAADVPMIKSSILTVCARIYVWYRPAGLHAPDEVASLISDYLINGLMGGTAK
jgi:TetR/AcrR family transcriptional regulator, cholesterol catabolism regulator